MRLDAPSSADLAPFLGRSLTWGVSVESWLGGQSLGMVPVSGGGVTWSTSREVPGSLDLVVPRLHPVPGGSSPVDWRPGRDESAPLARFGQELDVRLTVSVPGRVWPSIPLGRFLVTGTDPGPGVVRVSAESLTRRVVDDRLTSPTAPRSGGTLASEAKRLVRPVGLSLTIDDALTDRAVPSSMSWGESRIDALREIAEAWPARLVEDSTGGLHMLAPLADVPEPLDTLTDGEGGTVLAAYEQDTRDGTYNRVVARGQETTEAGLPAFQAVRQVSEGPLAANGPYGAVTYFFASPLLTSLSAAQAAATTRLAALTRPARTLPVTLAPDPRWEVGDAVAVVADGQTWRGWVSGVTIPLTVADGDMRMDVEVP